ncbi:hypothetical protein BDY19DRAFT_958142 [Irpex rosettiformis]|uniref:Uncharacterized protein n=1 Tax=Irpex rosettiformis TaxID=378272 RepID=A0ACB8TYM4_9APHY|nr:hypothetical protein BDY19DRAFT_958142 [Irpex rosettiformis]
MSVSQLREASQRIVQVDRAFSSPTLPHREVRILDSVRSTTCAEVALLPGGDRGIVLKENGSFDIHDITTGNVLLSAPRIEGSPVTKSFMRLYPTSLYTGHILVNAAVHITGANGLWRDRFNSAEFRVYHYTRTEIRHIWTEECPREMFEGRFAFCQQQSTLLLAQLHAPSDNPGEGSHLELHLRTIYKNGQGDKEILKFRLEIDVEGETHHILNVLVLSPRYLSYEGNREYRIVDTYQARDANGKILTLSPLWKGPPEMTGDATGSSTVARTTLGGETYVRSIIWPWEFEPRVIELPALSDINIVDPAYNVYHISVPEMDPELAHWSFSDIFHHLCFHFNYGFLYWKPSMPSYDALEEQDNLGAFSISHATGTNASSDGAPTLLTGLTRLGRLPTTTPHPEILLGNTTNPQSHARIGTNFTCSSYAGESMDEISGRIIQKQGTCIMLYTFDHQARIE